MTDFILKINGIRSKILLTDDGFTYSQGEVTSTIEYGDIVGFDNQKSKNEIRTDKRTLFYIIPAHDENKLKKVALHVSGSKDELDQLCSCLKEKTIKVEGRPQSVVVFLNPIGGSANACKLYRKKVEPIFKIAEIECELVVSTKAGHFKELGMSFDFSPYDALVILGGDGTVHELFNTLIHRKQNKCGIDVQDHNAVLKPIDIPIALIPTGSANGLAKVAHGCKDVVTSTLHIIKGRMKSFPVLRNISNNRQVSFTVLVSAYGLFADLLHTMQLRRWMRKLRYVFVPAWFFLWRTVRRFNTAISMEYADPMHANGQAINMQAMLPHQRQSKKNEKIILTNVFVIPFSSGVFIDDEDSDSDENFIVVLYEPNPTRCSIIKHFFSIMKKRKGVSRKDFEDSGFITVNTVKSFKAAVPNSQSDMDLNINLDGEVYKLTRPEIDIRIVPNVYRMYSSYEHNTKPTE